MIIGPGRGMEARATMIFRPNTLCRALAMLVSGAVLLQTTSCVFDAAGMIIQGVVSSYLFDALQVIFLNVLDV